MATSKLDKYKNQIMATPDGVSQTAHDKAIAKQAGVTLGAIRAYRKRHENEAPAQKPMTAMEKIREASEILGTVPDAEVAEKLGVKVSQVGRFRRNMGIDAFKAAPVMQVENAPAPEKKTKTKKTAPAGSGSKAVPTDVPIVFPETGKDCPKEDCDAHAEGTVESIHEVFGFRKVNSMSGEKRIPQSLCRQCRKASNKKNKKADASQAKAAK